MDDIMQSRIYRTQKKKVTQITHKNQNENKNKTENEEDDSKLYA